MTNHAKSSQPAPALDELATQLLACGAILSQIVSRMARNAAARRSAPDAMPIPDAAHEVILSAIADDLRRHRDTELIAAARIVQLATDALYDNVFFVPLD